MIRVPSQSNTALVVTLVILSLLGSEGFLHVLQKRLSSDKTSRCWAARPDEMPEEASIVPRHVAFICDGNTRWARKRGLPPSVGHAQGADRVIEVLETLRHHRVQFCTLYAFSTENWKRPATEIRDLLHIVERCARLFYDRVMTGQVRVRVLGNLHDERIPKSLRKALELLQEEHPFPENDPPITVCLALNYGGRQDILNASKKLVQQVQAGDVAPTDVSEDYFASLLDTRGVPDPDIIIRTSGERRLSNFMMWNAAYSELYFTDTCWPDFDSVSMLQALNWYSKRTRNYGSHHSVVGKISP